MGSAFGPVIDYLFTGTISVAASPLFGQTLLTQLQAVDPNVGFTDNLYTPSVNVGGESVVLLGRNSMDTANSSGTHLHLELGALKIEEQFDVPVFIMAHGPGPTAKPVRDIAMGHFNALMHFIQQDMTLNGLLLNGRVGFVNGTAIDQTENGDDSANGGMQTCTIAVTITCKNLYVP